MLLCKMIVPLVYYTKSHCFCCHCIILLTPIQIFTCFQPQISFRMKHLTVAFPWNIWDLETLWFCSLDKSHLSISTSVRTSGEIKIIIFPLALSSLVRFTFFLIILQKQKRIRFYITQTQQPKEDTFTCLVLISSLYTHVFI